MAIRTAGRELGLWGLNMKTPGVHFSECKRLSISSQTCQISYFSIDLYFCTVCVLADVVGRSKAVSLSRFCLCVRICVAFLADEKLDSEAEISVFCLFLFFFPVFTVLCVL